MRAPEISCVSFVGGRDTGADVATAVAGLGKLHILEQEGLNTWGIWDFSGWERLTAVVPKLFDYGKQRCTAYPRFVVQRSLFDALLDRPRHPSLPGRPQRALRRLRRLLARCLRSAATS